MRKLLLTTITLLMAVCMMAVGDGSGDIKANAIDFDWVDGHEHVGGRRHADHMGTYPGPAAPTETRSQRDVTTPSTSGEGCGVGHLNV